MEHCPPFAVPPSPTEAELKALARADRKKKREQVLSDAPPKKKQCVAAIPAKLEATDLNPPPFEETPAIGAAEAIVEEPLCSLK